MDYSYLVIYFGDGAMQSERIRYTGALAPGEDQEIAERLEAGKVGGLTRAGHTWEVCA